MRNSRTAIKKHSPGSGRSRARTGEPEKVQALIAFVRERGLCGNCLLEARCRLADRKMGGWRCRKYQPLDRR